MLNNASDFTEAVKKKALTATSTEVSQSFRKAWKKFEGARETLDGILPSLPSDEATAINDAYFETDVVTQSAEMIAVCIIAQASWLPAKNDAARAARASIARKALAVIGGKVPPTISMILGSA